MVRKTDAPTDDNKPVRLKESGVDELSDGVLKERLKVASGLERVEEFSSSLSFDAMSARE